MINYESILEYANIANVDEGLNFIKSPQDVKEIKQGDVLVFNKPYKGRIIMIHDSDDMLHGRILNPEEHDGPQAERWNTDKVSIRMSNWTLVKGDGHYYTKSEHNKMPKHILKLLK